MSVSYKNKIRLIEGDYFNPNAKEDPLVKAIFKLGLLISVVIIGFLYISKM